jgi:hypothetical protein
MNRDRDVMNMMKCSTSRCCGVEWEGRRTTNEDHEDHLPH